MDGKVRDEKRELDHDSYTVGWICVLRSELNASRALLDEVHRPLSPAENDDNSYLLGRMAGHNVVIAFTGSGTHGTNAAAQTVAHLTRTFRKIRFGLMVGVGGGAPKRPDPNDPSRDIRLGDVVVSVARGSHGGVLQYDMGKWVNKNEFRVESHLNKPPKILSKAIELLRSHHDFGEGKLMQYINEVAVKSTRLPALKEYRFPGRHHDQLFRSDYLHAGGSDCSSCDAAKVENRLARDLDDPVIHYGLIASGNAVMRSAQHRDKLRDAWDVLCFEMEAAGLLDDFPCIVIRGICDYSDDHKHKIWQPYAAVAAAAYAKDLLCVVQPQQVETLESAAIIASVFDAVRTTGEAVSRIESTVFKDKDSKILDWLTPISYGSQYSDLLKVRQRGTGQWFLDSAQYQTWLGSQKQTLFCPGIPGAGKTILASIVVESLFSHFENDQEVGIAYLYCNFQRQDKQKVDDLLASLLRQLAQRRPFLPDELTSLHDEHKDKQTRPSVDEIFASLQSVARIYSKVFIVVDALDECEKDCMPKFLSQLFSLQASTTANVLATSRPIEMIKKKFEGRSETANISARNEDVEKCLDIDMRTLPLLDKDNGGLSEKSKEDLRNEIKTMLVKCANGMFLLARLHLASLIDKTTESDLRNALKSLPNGQNALAQAYGSTMERIRSQQPGFRFLAEMVLTLLTCARRRLTTLELQDALAVTKGDQTLDKTKREHTSIIVSVCAGLVTVDAESGIIRLVHETTREYFASHMHCIRPQKALTTTANHVELDDEKNTVAMAEAHKTFAIICVTYLSFSDFESGFCHTDAAFEERLQSNQLYKYAAHNWGYHAREASTCCPSVIEFLKDAPKVEASSQVLMASKSLWRSDWSQDLPHRVMGLHLAAYFGLQETVGILLQDWQNVDQKDSWGQTPLSYAAKNGHVAVVELLLTKNKVDANAKGGRYGRTPLSYAAEKGYAAVVELLLASDKVDVNAKASRYGRTPLSYAAKNGHAAIVELLLATVTVNADAKDYEEDRTPLSYAAENNHEAVVKLLLASDKVDVNAKAGRYGQTPLSYAAEKGYAAVVELLLASDKVDVNAKASRYGRTPLSYAAENGHVAVVELLLTKNKVDANAKGGRYGRTPLSYAAEKGYAAVVELLLASDKVDVNAKASRYGRTPLSYAAKNGHAAIVKLLLATVTVNADAKDYEEDRTPLSYAAENNHEAVVKLLLASDKVDVNAKASRYGRTPLSYAAKNGHAAIVKLLLATVTVNADAKDYEEDRTPLSYAAENNHEAVVKLLLASDKVDVNAKASRYGRTPLSYAAKNGHVAIVDLLLATVTVTVDAKDYQDRTPLSYAAEHGYEAIVKLLLATDKVDVDAKDDSDRTSLSYAAKNGHVAIVELLVATVTVTFDAKDYQDRTPLSYAAEHGYEAIVKLLLATDKVDVDAKDYSDRTSLSYAAKNGHVAIVELLLATVTVTVDAKDYQDRTPLSYAAEHGYEAIVKLLLATDKVDVDAKDDSDRTSLSYAVKNGHQALVKLLWAMTALPDPRTALLTASWQRRLDGQD